MKYGRYGYNTVFKRVTEYGCSNPATMNGVAKKSVIMLLMALLSTIVCAKFLEPLNAAAGGIIVFGYLISPFLTFILSMIMSFNPNAAKTLAIPYAILEGVSIGSLAGLLTAVLGSTGGLIVSLAFVITLSFFLGASVLYCTGLIKVDSRLRRLGRVTLFGLLISTLMINIIGIFNPLILDFFYGNTNFALIFAVISVLIASIYSMISLDNAHAIVEAGVDKNYEWYAAFGIVLNVIWLFWEVLRLVLIIFSRSDN